MIALTTNRSMTTQGGLELSNTDSRGREITNRKDERVVIAIDPAEAVPLTQALGSKLAIHMVTRSGQSIDQHDDSDLLEGMIAFPATSKPIKAFSMLSAADLAEPLSGALRQYYFDPQQVRDGWIPRAEQLVGRVVNEISSRGTSFQPKISYPLAALSMMLLPIRSYQQVTSSVETNRSGSTV